MKSLSDTPANRAFLGALVRQMVRHGDAPLSPQDEAAIAESPAAIRLGNVPRRVALHQDVDVVVGKQP